jgi:hypothetical protein
MDVYKEESTEYTYQWTPPELKQLYQNINSLKISDNAQSFIYVNLDNESTVLSSIKLTVTYPNGKEEVVYKRTYFEKGSNTLYVSKEIDITTKQTGEYKLRFDLSYTYTKKVNEESTTTIIYNTNRVAYIYVQHSSDTTIEQYTLKKTIQRLLDITPTKKNTESNRFSFDDTQMAEFATEESPEFSFEGNTLFEALNTIAGYKGMFPTLKDNVVSFKPMWNGVYLTESDLPDPIEEVASSDITQYCTYVDSDVQNLVGVNDSQVGSITEPYAGGWKTTRTVSGSEISQDTAIIATDYPIYLLTKLEIGHIGNNFPTYNDLTAYVYESGDYNSLSDTTAAYPYSKAYALKWTQGEQNITELSHRITGEENILQAFQTPALANIVNAKGYDLDTGLAAWIKGLIGVNDDGNSFADLMFRTTYIPKIDARIKQYKTNYSEFGMDGGLKYNQTAELVDSEMYGKHLKELIKKLGNAVKRSIYIFRTIDEVPKVGTIVDGWSVYDVAMTITENRVVATISYVKYAELSQYIGVKNPWKDSDVSTSKWRRRSINYSEFMLFTHDGTKAADSGSWIELPGALGNYLDRYLPFVGTDDTINSVVATGYMTDGTACNTVILPVVSLAIGSSILFHWQYENNYSAGGQSQKAPDGATNVITGTKYNRAQKSVRYADTIGRLNTYNFRLAHTTISGDSADSARTRGNALPEYSATNIDQTEYFGVSNLLVEKDSGEALSFDVQIHNYSDNENFIIGSGLTNFCPLIGGALSADRFFLYGFENRLNPFNRFVSLTDGSQIGNISDLNATSADEKVTMTLPSKINNYNAWALLALDKNGNYQIVFGENRAYDGTSFKTELYMIPKRNHD